jgi:hypothetical protein
MSASPSSRRKNFRQVSKDEGAPCESLPTLTNFLMVNGRAHLGNMSACFMNAFVQLVCTAFFLLAPLKVGRALVQNSATYILEEFFDLVCHKDLG